MQHGWAGGGGDSVLVTWNHLVPFAHMHVQQEFMVIWLAYDNRCEVLGYLISSEIGWTCVINNYFVLS